MRKLTRSAGTDSFLSFFNWSKKDTLPMFSRDSENCETTFTRQGSQVQSLYRPPYLTIAFNRLGAFFDSLKNSWGQTGVKHLLSPFAPIHALKSVRQESSRTPGTQRKSQNPSAPIAYDRHIRSNRDVVLKSILLASVFAVSGCATCQQHPTACSIATMVALGSVIATVEANSHGHSHFAPPDACGPNSPNRSNGVVGSCVGKGIQIPQIPFVHPIHGGT